MVISDPILAKDLFSISTDLIERAAYRGGRYRRCIRAGVDLQPVRQAHRQLLVVQKHPEQVLVSLYYSPVDQGRRCLSQLGL
ncbi:MAG: hypothetical protein WBZ15_22205 [Mycobacterium sp.]|uniref:hypothetical protein n=1 Tax=Mycobacterium sp. TaxID=1785 RepID=UPI003C4E4348